MKNTNRKTAISPHGKMQGNFRPKNKPIMKNSVKKGGNITTLIMQNAEPPNLLSHQNH
jgi:hypothetical protein